MAPPTPTPAPNGTNATPEHRPPPALPPDPSEADIQLPFAPGPSAEEEGMVAPGYHPAEVPEDGITIPMAPGRALKGHQADTPLNPD